MQNRWLVALAAVGIHISIGSVYAWSVLTKPVMEAMGISMKETTFAFSLAILFLGFSAALLGSFVEKIGPRKSGLLSAAFFGTGMLGTALAIHLNSLGLLYLAYGCIGGIGLGIGYITPVSTLVKHFPDHKGFATGLAIMGFGFAALIAGPAMQYLTEAYGLVQNFVIMGMAYMTLIAASSMCLKPPTAERCIAVPLEGMKRGEAIRTWEFATLWWVFFVNISCGIGLLAVASPMAQEVVGITPIQAATLVGAIGILNGGGRIFWSSISDIIGRNQTYFLFFIIETCAFSILSDMTDVCWFHVLVFLIVSCYGGGFSCMPAYLSDLFGSKHLSAIHGCILSAWGVAGIVGPTIISVLRESTNGYAATMQLFAACFAVNMFIMLALHRNRRENTLEVVCNGTNH